MMAFLRRRSVKKTLTIVLVALIVVSGIPVMIGPPIDGAMLHDCSADLDIATGCSVPFVTIVSTLLLVGLTAVTVLAVRQRDLLRILLTAPLERPPQLA